MGLNIGIFEDHLVITDGCEIDSVASNVVDSRNFRCVDGIVRNSSSIDMKRYLWACNIAIVSGLSEMNARFKLRCPVCNGIYEVGSDELRFGVRAYRDLLAKGESLR